MNKQKSAVKIFSVVLCLMMLVGICPDFGVITSAANPTKIASISIADIEPPRPGVTPDYNAAYDIHCNKTTRFDDGEQLINGIAWKYQKVNTTKLLKNTDKFEENVQYTVTIIVKVKDGYEFDAADNYNSKVTAYVNSKKANVQIISGYSAKEVILISYTFNPCEYFTVKTVRIADVKIPKMGEQVSFDATPAGTGYTVSMVKWYDETAHEAVLEGDVFKGNHEYTIEVFIRAAAGCRLKTDEDDGPDFTAKINNVEAELIYAYTNGGVGAGVKMTYSTDSVIKEISVSDIEIPRAGKLADHTCKIDGIGYELDDELFGIVWTKNGGYGTELAENEPFQAGQSYELKVWLKAQDGYSFLVNWQDEVIADAKINGEEAEVYLNATDKDCQIILVYDVPANITSVAVTGVVEPFAGGTAMMTAVSASPDYEVTDVEWKDTTGEYKDYIYNITSFSEGREYTVDITLKPTGNNSFRPDPDYDIPDITAKINGRLSGVYSEGGRDEAIIYYRFKTPVEVVTVTGLTEPAADQTPDMTAESTKAGYEIKKIEWFDNSVTPAVKLSETDKFVAGHSYTVQITLYACDDFIFNVAGGYQEITATINGKDAIEYGSDSYATAEIGYKFTIPAPHTHTPSGWKTDANRHWKVCTDSDCGKITSAKENHKDANGDEKCDVCAYPMPKPVTKELTLKKGCTYTVSHTDKTVIIPADTKISEIKANITNEKYAVLTSDKKTAADNATAGTGMKIQILGKDSAVLSEYTVIVIYDVNGNGTIDAADARLVLRASVGLEEISNEYFIASDINNTGALEASDARSILRKSVGLD